MSLSIAPTDVLSIISDAAQTAALLDYILILYHRLKDFVYSCLHAHTERRLSSWNLFSEGLETLLRARRRLARTNHRTAGQ